jgi:hypothetical protein
MWKIRIFAKLRREKVLAYATGQTPQPTTTTPTPQIYTSVTSTTTWEEGDEKVHGLIIEHISDRIALQVAHLPTSKELLDEVICLHESMNVSVQAFFALVEVVGAQWDGVLDIQDHIGRIWAASQTLSAMGRPLGDEFLAFLLLHSLPHEDTTWDTFRTTILNAIPVVAAPAPGAVATAPLLTFDTVEMHLIAQVDHNLQTSTESALKASMVSGGPSCSSTTRTLSSTARTTLNKQPPPGRWLTCLVHGQCSHTSADCCSLKACKKEKDCGPKTKGKSQSHSVDDGNDSSSSSDESAHAHHVLVGKCVMKNLSIRSSKLGP